ncbi:MAG: hypothetical protein J6S67_22115 [Methanobrevibacter sp.]|nr:hypothetical protein [Methanobrevibacter sp.]
MTQRKKKFKDIYLLNYHQFKRCIVNGARGWCYWCDKIDRATLETFDNIKIFSSRCEYAPELKSVVVFVGDKCF